jgi:hypothetical protein
MDGPFPLKDGRIVDLLWDDGAEEMTAWTTTEPREKIGEISFLYVVEGDDYCSNDHYRVTHMDLRGPDRTNIYRRKGIGREIIRRIGEMAPVLFGPDDGSRPINGSYLIDDGPDFATAMEREGLAGQQNTKAFDVDERED